MLNAGATEQDLADKLMQSPVFGLSLGQMNKIRESSSVADGKAIYEIGKLFIVLVAPVAFPDVAADEARAIRLAKTTLPPRLSSFLLEIVAEGRLDDGRSFIAFHRGRPLSANPLTFAWQKRSIKPEVLGWLRGLAREARGPSEDTCDEFKLSLESLAAMPGLPKGITNSAVDGLSRLSKHQFSPRYCPMHGDLWKGNVIYAPDGTLKVIDWRGSRMDGYGIFDLVKFAQSFGINARDFSREITIHSQSLEVEIIDAWTTLLASCGYISRNLGEFPRDRFIVMTTSLCNFFLASMSLKI